MAKVLKSSPEKLRAAVEYSSRAEVKQRRKERDAANRESINAAKRAWAATPEAKQKRKEYAEANIEKIRAQAAAWARAHPVTAENKTPERRAYEAKWKREWRAKNPEAAAKAMRDWFAAHPEYRKQKSAEHGATPKAKAWGKQYRKIHAREIAAYKSAWHKANPNSERYHSDLPYKLRVILRSRLGTAIKTKAKKGSAVRLLGCSIPEVIAHIEAQFKPGMTWENWSRSGWHIDHKKALTRFDLEDPKQLAEACHYTNLQPLWATENIRKGNRLCFAD